LNDFIDHIEELILKQFKSARVVFRVARDPRLPEKMYADPAKLEQILFNLILNAQKFTEKGFIKLKIWTHST
jgi:signal transduction histidine kinase